MARTFPFFSFGRLCQPCLRHYQPDAADSLPGITNWALLPNAPLSARFPVLLSSGETSAIVPFAGALITCPLKFKMLAGTLLMLSPVLFSVLSFLKQQMPAGIYLSRFIITYV